MSQENNREVNNKESNTTAQTFKSKFLNRLKLIVIALVGFWLLSITVYAGFYSFGGIIDDIKLTREVRKNCDLYVSKSKVEVIKFSDKNILDIVIKDIEDGIEVELQKDTLYGRSGATVGDIIAVDKLSYFDKETGLESYRTYVPEGNGKYYADR